MSLFIFFKNLFTKHRLDEATGESVFDHYFFDLKYYTRKDASIEDLSHLLNISIQKLDQISIEKYACSFDMLLNENRYKHLINELESPLNSSLTIDSILKLSGYTSNQKFVDYVESKEASALSIKQSFIK
jgi:hypothetical protein